MRRLPMLAAALVAAGCNQLLGLDETRPRDAGAPDVPQRIGLSYALAPTDPATGQPVALAYPPLALAGPIEVSALDGTQASLPTYADGSFEVPGSVFAAPWRLVFQPTGDVPHEVQWQPNTGAHLTLPLHGRLERLAAPAGSGYVVTPSSFTGSHLQHAVFTTGIWTIGAGTFSGATVDYPFPANARSLSGERGRPDPTLGDRMLLVDYGGIAPCRSAIGWAEFAEPLQDSMKTTTTPVWRTDRAADPTVAIDVAEVGRLSDVAALAGATRGSALRIGTLPSDQVTAFTTPPAASAPADPTVLGLASPVMIELQACSDVFVNPPAYQDPRVLADLMLPHVGYVEITNVRAVPDGPRLVSGIAMVARRVNGGSGTITFDHTAPHATAIRLGGADLSGTAENVGVPASATGYELAFEPSGGTADYWDIVLHQVVTSTLTPKRVFTILGASKTVQIASEHLPAGTYVLEIRGYDGFATARSGDFRMASLPQSSTTLFTRTFVIP